MTPIDTVREALERVEAVHSKMPIPVTFHGTAIEALTASLIAEGRDLLEAMEKHGHHYEPVPIEGKSLPLHFDRMAPWTHTLAQSYARRVGEVVS